MIRADNITLGYKGTPLVSGVNFTLERGKVCAVIGHNGSGKSTLVRTLMGLQPPLAGRFHWQTNASCEMAYLGQSADLDNQFPMRVKDAVAMGAWKNLGLRSSINAQKSAKIDQALARTGLTGMANRPLYECSSGQLQRCFFARAIVQDAPLILLDEPFSAIDQQTQSNLVKIVKEWRDEGRALLIVLHDISTVMGLADSCLLLGDGRASFGASQEVLTTDNLLTHHYLTDQQAEWLSLLNSKEGAQNV
ncbi:MAG: metal ABC transporter ATP-binding protein [Candidatus Puniceispirillaceae bacterium]